MFEIFPSRIKQDQQNDRSFNESVEVPHKNIQGILGAVNFETEDQNKPKIYASEYAGEQFEVLEKSFDTVSQEDEPSVVAVVRGWNKKIESLKEFLERIEKFKQHIPNLKGVLIIINKGGEKDGFTEENLKTIFSEMKGSVPVIPLQVEKYSWTAGLNAGAAILNEMCLEKGIDRKDLRVANISFDTDLDEDELEKCNNDIRGNEFVVTARKTSEGESPFVGGHGDGELWDRFKNMLRSPRAAKLSELAYTMRNTFNVISLEDIVSMGGFNPLCNGEAFTPNRSESFSQMKRPEEVAIAGMEDVEFFMRLVFRALQNGEKGMLKELKVAMDNPVFYKDKAWASLHELKKIDKIGNEMMALSFILSDFSTKKTVPTRHSGETRTVGLVKDFYVPGVMQDFSLRR